MIENEDVLTVVLAGGKGERLGPLTRERAKPAVHFGGIYRIVDLTLSNCVNSGLRKILVLTQYVSRSLSRHLNESWRFISRPTLGDVYALCDQEAGAGASELLKALRAAPDIPPAPHVDGARVMASVRRALIAAGHGAALPG